MTQAGLAIIADGDDSSDTGYECDSFRRKIHKVIVMAQIDVIVAVNGAQLAQQVRDGSLKPGSVSAPTFLGSWQQSDVYIAMIAQSSYVSNYQGQSELAIKANSGDIVRWSMTTFGNNSDYTAFIYSGSFNPSQNITPLSYINMVTSEYLPSGSNPTGGLANYHDHVYVAQAVIVQPGGQIQYTMSFQLVDNSSGQVIGYFYWDPFINVSP